MKIVSTYSVKVRYYNRIFKDTVLMYRAAMDFLIGVIIQEWDTIAPFAGNNEVQGVVEGLTHKSKNNPSPKYDFDTPFKKFPSYLRRAVIMDAVGLVSSYKSNYLNWESNGKIGNPPGYPKAGNSYPVMYKGNMYNETGTYTAEVKIYNAKTRQWVWLPVRLRKTDIDYIKRYCGGKEKLAPSLTRRGKEWFLDFPFEEVKDLHKVPIYDQLILAVDLGINNACVCTIMSADGAVHGRHFLKLPVETDHLSTAINRIKKAQQHGAKHTPRLWAVANGINDDIARKTVKFIMDLAVLYSVDTIVFEHLDLTGKKRGRKKQKLHLWKVQAVQKMVEHKAHKLGMRISRICAWGTSKLAFDGSGAVSRGTYIQDGVEKYNYSICVFKTGKVYHCDLNASYNIGARYFVRELLKSLPEKERLDLEAKVPSASKRTTTTLSTLISLNAVLKTLNGTPALREETPANKCVA